MSILENFDIGKYMYLMMLLNFHTIWTCIMQHTNHLCSLVKSISLNLVVCGIDPNNDSSIQRLHCLVISI